MQLKMILLLEITKNYHELGNSLMKLNLKWLILIKKDSYIWAKSIKNSHSEHVKKEGKEGGRQDEIKWKS